MDPSTRVSDRDRDTVLRLLGEQAALGRLTYAELDERTDAALTARTWGDLHALTADLPVDAVLRGEPTEPPPQRRRRSRLCLLCLVPFVLAGLAASLGTVGPVGLLVAVPLCIVIAAKAGGSPRSWCR
ncbi:MAG: DUF1707 domain-containing protein [Streptosporangiales bacterium]|nr:DUF1707 domain-containing protein [Streptosporangiales bacterium]